ncbi:hypothetical protein [Chitinimonas sp.]|uniref:hypothetical protein n=1 Tax=Chitinimonas sp. TaxID=1934313 RepID=UPI0035AEF919
MKSASLLALTLSLPAFANDVLLDFYKLDKEQIADQYKRAIQACNSKPAKDATACKTTADQHRQQALHTASAERDHGLGCRSSCGRVDAVKHGEVAGKDGTAGAVVGGVAGAVVGRQLAGDSSASTKNVATAAGAIGGALLGKKIAEDSGKHQAWTVSYTLYDGNKGSAEFAKEPGLKAGDKIEVKGGKPSKR